MRLKPSERNTRFTFGSAALVGGSEVGPGPSRGSREEEHRRFGPLGQFAYHQLPRRQSWRDLMRPCPNATRRQLRRDTGDHGQAPRCAQGFSETVALDGLKKLAGRIGASWLFLLWLTTEVNSEKRRLR